MARESEKTRFFAALLSMCFCAAAAPGYGFSAAVVTGLNGGFAASNPAGTGSIRLGAVIGVQGEQRLSEAWDLQFGLSFVQQGVRTELLELVPGTVRLEGLALPVAAIYRLNPEFYLSGGAEPTFFVHRALNISDVLELSLAERFSIFDLAVQLGAGVQWKLQQNIRLFVEARFLLGLIDLDTSALSSYYSRALRIQAGVGF